MTFTFVSTDAEDAAILALTATTAERETVDQFFERHLRHQLAFVVSRQTEASRARTSEALTKVTPEEQAQIDSILAKYLPDAKSDAGDK
jgi:hypothetical protein